LGTRYIGSKARIAESIIDIAGQPSGSGRFIDAFCGTGSVSHVASRRGWSIFLNDFMKSAIVMASAGLVHEAQISFANFGGYQSTLDRLNSLAPKEGFFYREYSPASLGHLGFERKYFSELNASRIDAIRSEIITWYSKGDISKNEEILLLGDLINATNSVANISGTYGCFLSTWTDSSRKQLELKPRVLSSSIVDWESRSGDVFDIPANEDDLIYFDPPYTKRQYAAYYHLLETLVIGDEPEVSGITGLRPWQDRSSVFCYKKKALNALVTLIDLTPSKRILLSYSNEGHISQNDLENALSKVGTMYVHEIQQIGRYRPNSAASSAGEQVSEYVIEVQKTSSLVLAGN
jgi:adenine-specific DNA-methyltransferase